MSQNRPKRSNDLVFIYLEEAYSYWKDSEDMKIPMLRLALFTSPKKWTGEDMLLSDFIEAINGLAGKYHWRPRSLAENPGRFMLNGGEAFGIVHYAVEKALVGSHSLKATKETLPILNDLQAILLNRWAYADHQGPTPERTAYHYEWSAVMAAQRVQGRRLSLELSSQQKERIKKTAVDVNAAYGDLMPEFCDLMAHSHIMHLGKGFGERLLVPGKDDCTELQSR